MGNNIPTFQNFWDAYALKRDRIAAERAWNKLSASDRCDAFDKIAAYKDECQRQGIRRMYAQGYLNHRRWEDDFTTDDRQNGSTPIKMEMKKHIPTKMSGW